MGWVLLKVAVAAGPVLVGAMVHEDKMAEGPRAAIKAFCAEEWPTDFDMQAYCQGKQSAAYWRWTDAAALAREIEAKSAPTAYEAAFRTSLEGCEREWWGSKNQPDFDMIVYCLLKQMTAYERLSK